MTSRLRPEKERVRTDASLRTVAELLAALRTSRGLRSLEKIYGNDPALLRERRKAYEEVLRTFADTYGGNRRVLLVRSPARINLRGVHVEHRRGEVNYVTHRREVLMVAEPRSDRIVDARNVLPDFPARRFDIAEEAGRGRCRDWLEYIECPQVTRVVAKMRGDWANYIRAALLRLQFRFPRKGLRGMNLMVSGDIPPSAGLSSSSALVVTSALAAVALNRLRISTGDLAVLCGEGEWYVGTRGGAGDHAAMILGRRGYMAHLRFFPLELLEYVFLPRTHGVVICNSLRQAKKSSTELSAYNETISSYGMVLVLMKEILAEEFGFGRKWLDRHVRHLGDFNLLRDKFPEALLYRVLRRMPQRVSRRQLLRALPAHKAELRKMFRTHNEPANGYRVRAVAMFGLSEIARGAEYAKHPRRKDFAGAGRLMVTSHDGDRIVRHTDEDVLPWDNAVTRVSDDYLDALIRDLEDGNRASKAKAQLARQPGGYRCSSEALDQLVDIASQVRGVAGAGLTGAGLGGCVLVLVDNSSVRRLLDAVRTEYYEPRELPFGAEVCRPVDGAGVVEF